MTSPIETLIAAGMGMYNALDFIGHEYERETDGWRQALSQFRLSSASPGLLPCLAALQARAMTSPDCRLDTHAIQAAATETLCLTTEEQAQAAIVLAGWRGETLNPITDERPNDKEITMYVYITTPNAGKNNNDLHTVGHYTPDGKWTPESDHDTDERAAARVHWLNGGQNISQLEKRLAHLEVDNPEYIKEFSEMKRRAIDYALIVEQFQKLLGVFTTTEALAKVAVLMREETLSESLLSKALGHLNTCSESDSNDLYKEIAAAFGEVG